MHQNLESSRGSLEINKIGLSNYLRQLSPGGAKKNNFAALQRLSPDEKELNKVGRMSGSFILRSMQQEEALHHI
ncbi:unnamed protein product [Spirodela intermedia]|uniref:Uncharacterized protein n=1 Tax=Spirodela intermedia TaxID=51605 RepID=A0ABN7EBS3_SPIIN|nr:unnamed protein product [Spirodela intermedia]